MKTKTTVIRGLAFDIVVAETMHSDSKGTLFYLAIISLRSRKTGIQRAVRRSRIPGTGEALAEDVRQNGIRVLDALAA